MRVCVVSHLDAKYWEATRRAERLVRIPQAAQIPLVYDLRFKLQRDNGRLVPHSAVGS